MTLAVLLGAALSVLAALNQPYNQNEWAQMAPYDSWDPSVVTSGTRQPPLDPILGALVQHLLGVGQLQQRVVPVLAGVGSLILVGLLLHRLRLHLHGVVALWFMATAPLFVRYNAYTRPYALPLMLMLLCAYAGSRWLEDGRRRWLAVAIGAAFLLPLTRVPEPVAFLASSVVVLLVGGWRHWLPRLRAWQLAGGMVVAMVSVGALATIRLSGATAARTGQSLIDLNPGRALDRLPTGLRELWNFVLPLYGDWFPWWPITLLVIGLALLLPAARRVLTSNLGGSWWWLPLVLGPLAFLVAYHTVNPYPLDQRHYRMRFASFWVPSLTVLVALASYGLSTALRRVGGGTGLWTGPLLVGALVATQLPMTAYVLTRNDTIDVGAATALVEREVPDDALVIYDGPARVGYWRQPFFGGPRYFEDQDHPRVLANTTKIAGGQIRVTPNAGPVYLLLIDGACVSSVVCDAPEADWDGEVDGFEAIQRVDRFTLYAPASGQSGRAGVIEAMGALAEAYGPGFGVRNLLAKARLLDDDGRREEAKALLLQACDEVPAGLADACDDEIRKLRPLEPRQSRAARQPPSEA